MTFRLQVICGPDRGSQFALGDGQETVIGRGLDCTLRLADPTVSRRHCRIAVQDGQATLYDDDSRWGTLVNGEVTRCHELQPGDRITVGETSLLVAVSAAHRREAFEACHYAVDRIKEIVPIWKKEIFDDGDGAWVTGHPVEASQQVEAKPDAYQPGRASGRRSSRET